MPRVDIFILMISCFKLICTNMPILLQDKNVMLDKDWMGNGI